MTTPSPEAAALSLKNEGNTHYKAREFEQAIEKYEEAYKTNIADVTPLINKAAVLFEQAKFEECRNTCLDAVEKGREQRTDYKLIAKAFARIAAAYAKEVNYPEAIKYYQKAMAEHRNPDAQQKLRETEKLYEEEKKRKLHDPKLADEFRSKGNEFFKAQKYAEAVKEYTQAITHDLNDPRAYSNRAACYTKLIALPSAVKDCDTCISIAPTFVKAYIRKANALFLMREYTRVIEACDKGIQVDTESGDGKNIQELNQWKYKANVAISGTSKEERRKAAANNPEVQNILRDPVMQKILQDMQSDPAAVREHLRNPDVAKKLQVLVDSGIVETA